MIDKGNQIKWVIPYNYKNIGSNKLNGVRLRTLKIGGRLKSNISKTPRQGVNIYNSVK